MPKQFVRGPFEILNDDCEASVELVGSHLQNIGITVQSGFATLDFIVSPSGARKLMQALQQALDIQAENSQRDA